MSGAEKSIVRAITVGEGGDPRLLGRLDIWLAANLEGVSRAKIQRMIAAGDVQVNGRKARAKDSLMAGDVVSVRPEAPRPSSLEPVKMDLMILYEDDHIIVIDKPAGLSVHPGAGDTGPTLVQGLLYHVGDMGLGRPQSDYEDPLANLRPGIVHRLDKDTTGVMVCAKSDRAHADLARQFQDKQTLRREYGALLDGCLKQIELVHESWLKRDPIARVTFASSASATPGARYAKSHFRVQEVFRGRLSLVRVRLYTGRTHQIRVHAKDLGAPIVGDLVYHRPTVLPTFFPPAIRQAVSAISRQMLHAKVLAFRHPLSQQEMCFEAEYPPDFKGVLDLLQHDQKNQASPQDRR